MSEARANFSVKPLPLAAGLGAIGDCLQVPDSQVRSHGCRKFLYELRSDICQYIRFYTVPYGPIVDEYGLGAC